jgi:hypothetical protein
MLTFSGLVTSSFALLITVSASHALAQAQKKPMSCKLQSEKVIAGKEKQCLYVCEDKQLEGRSRKVDSDCPTYITTIQ